MTAEDVARAASFGDPVAVALLQTAGRRVGSMLASVVNFFNPSLIVIGGGVANSPELFLAAIRETVYRRSLPLATRELRVAHSSLGGLAGVIGASAMVVDQLFARESIGRWLEAGDPSGAAELTFPGRLRYAADHRSATRWTSGSQASTIAPSPAVRAPAATARNARRWTDGAASRAIPSPKPSSSATDTGRSSSSAMSHSERPDLSVEGDDGRQERTDRLDRVGPTSSERSASWPERPVQAWA